MILMSVKSKNVTFTLPPELVERYKFFAQNKFIPSVNAGVKEAMEEYLITLEKELLKNEMQQAARDLIFMSDLADSMNAFESIDEETNKEPFEW
jgi:predicted DNA-binding protein